MAVKSSPNRPAARQPRPSQAPSRTTPPRPPRNNDRFAHDIWGLVLVTLGLYFGRQPCFCRTGAMPGCSATGWWRACGFVVGIGLWVFPVLLTAIGVMLIQGKHRPRGQTLPAGQPCCFSSASPGGTSATRPAPRSSPTSPKAAGSARRFHRACGRWSATFPATSVLFLFTVGQSSGPRTCACCTLFDHAVAGGRRVTPALSRRACMRPHKRRGRAQLAVKSVQPRLIYTPVTPKNLSRRKRLPLPRSGKP